MEALHTEYIQERMLSLNEEQFIYIVNLFPAIRVVLSDGIVDQEEWQTVKHMAKILGDEFASDDLGNEKEENLMLIYKAEFRYLIKNLEKWEAKFLDALKEYFELNDASHDFVLETMLLFAHASDGVSEEESKTIDYLVKELDLKGSDI